MLTTSLIERKRNGESLSGDEWHDLIAEYTAGRIPDYQMAALLMAVLFRGMEPHELIALTEAMCDSGGKLEFGDFAIPRIDKHSTGGVGDKVSLVLAPLVASCGVAVPMMSGRGLGHTGGTLDKLESIPGFSTGLRLEQAKRQVESIGCAMFGQSSEIAPADRKLYALRDATATVESIPLIVASIMSKKLAEGLNGLVLDIKSGSGAFLTTTEEQVELARTMLQVSADHGCAAVALITAMDRPLGRACGNALEVEEAFAALLGQGPLDLMEVTYALGVEMLLLAGADRSRAAARDRLEQAVGSGRAAEKCRELIAAQGGNPAVLDDPIALPQAPRSETFAAGTTGTVVHIEPRAIGKAVTALGCGRRTMDDEIDPSVGFVIAVKPGDQVNAGDPIATVYARDQDGIALGRQALERAVRIGTEDHLPVPLISRRVTPEGVEVLQ